MHFHICGNLWHDVITNAIAAACFGFDYTFTLVEVARSVYYDLTEEYDDRLGDSTANAAAAVIERLLYQKRRDCAVQYLRFCDGLDSPRLNKLRDKLPEAA